MMTFEQATKAFNKKYPKKHIMSAADLDSNNYVVNAQENVNEIDNSDPTFYINKKTGAVTQISSTLDEIIKIDEAFEKRKIK